MFDNNTTTGYPINDDEDEIPELGRYDTDSDDEDESGPYPQDSDDNAPTITVHTPYISDSARQPNCSNTPTARDIAYNYQDAQGSAPNPYNPALSDHTTSTLATTNPTRPGNDQASARRTRSGYLLPSQVIHTHQLATHEPTQTQVEARINQTPRDENFYIGDVLSLPKAENTTRIYFQNVNGINLCHRGTWMDTCEHFRDMQVDVALVVEHKLDTTQPNVMKRLHEEPRRIFEPGSYSINASSTQVEAQSIYKPGGVLSLTTGAIKGRILETGKDPLGRWVYTKYRRNIGPPITVVVTYQVVDCDPS